MVNYQEGKIYEIRSKETNKRYIGSTSKKYLSDRMSSHKTTFKHRNSDKYHYSTAFEILQYDDAYIQLIESFPCNSKYELEKREREIIEQYKDLVVNTNLPTRTKQEYEKVRSRGGLRAKEFRAKNKDKLTAIEVCQCGSKFQHWNKSVHLKTKKHLEYINNL